MFAEKSAQQCLFLKAFGCDGVMVNQVALLTHGQNIGTGKTTSAFTISYNCNFLGILFCINSLYLFQTVPEDIIITFTESVSLTVVQ